MKFNRRVICLFLVLSMTLSLTCISFTSTSAAQAQILETEDFKFLVHENGNAFVFKCYSKDENIIIPSTVDKYTVVGISGSTFTDISHIKSVTIPDTVTSIDSETFKNCTGLESITIPDSVTDISDYAFYGCSNLAFIDIPDNAELYVGVDAFAETLWYKSQPEGVVYLENFALGYNGEKSAVTELMIKDGTEVLGLKAFEDCKNIETVILPESLKRIDTYAFRNCTNLKTIDLPGSITTMHTNVFSGCENLKNIDIPEGVSDITGVFSGCGLESVTIADTVKAFNNAFMDCKNLTEVTLSNGISCISNYAFANCVSLESIVIPESVTEIGAGAFSGCTSLGSIHIEGEINDIGYKALADSGWYTAQPDGPVYFEKVLLGIKGDTASYDEVLIKGDTLAIADFAFIETKHIESIVIPDGVKRIGTQAFANSVLKEVVIPDSVKVIESYAFVNCELDNLVLGDGIEILGEKVFLGCDKVKTVTLTENIKEIGEYALGFTTVFPSDVVQIDDFILQGFSGTVAESYAESNGIEFVSIGEVIETTASEPITQLPTTVHEESSSATDVSEGETTNSTEVTETLYQSGDVNKDGKLNIRDATAIQKYCAKIIDFDNEALKVADFDDNGKVNVKDATAIQKKIAGL